MEPTAESRFALPYLGPDSFQPEDAELFFGREREAEQLIAMILSARCTLLHAQSGAGKTSLLNTLVIPGLEARGHTPIRILPQDDPIESVRRATIQHLLPPPQAEIMAIERAAVDLGLDEEASLGDLLEGYDGLGTAASGAPPRESQEKKRHLVAPVDVESLSLKLAMPLFGTSTPYVCRLLRASMEIGTFAAHLEAVSPAAARSVGLDGGVDEATPLARILDLLLCPRFEADYVELLEALYLPVPGLRPFFENLFDVDRRRTEAAGRWRRLSPVLIFDQFEELFTRFVDLGRQANDDRDEMPSWRLRWLFFRELESLYAGERESAGGDGASGERLVLLPMRFVISIRNEFVAGLDPVRRLVPDLGRSTFHLKLLDKAAAEEAIEKPAERYGVRFGTGCVERIVDQLALEERFVEPPYIQIICDRLWRRLTLGEVSGAANEITVEDFQALGETRGILDRFFREFLDGLAGPEERLETLEMLERLITASGTRNIVARDELASAPFRRPKLRKELLSRLQNGNIVRIEHRMGNYFVEITHEFLIAPIQKELVEQTRDPKYRSFQTALDRLSAVKSSGAFREERRPFLDGATLKSLEEHERRLRWGYLGTEAMLRASILAGGDKDTLGRWSKRFREGDEMWSAELILTEAPGSALKKKLLSLDELEAVFAAVDSDALDPAQLDPGQVHLVLRSVLVMAGDEDRQRVVDWTREAMRHGT